MEESAKGSASVFAVIPVMLGLIVTGSADAELEFRLAEARLAFASGYVPPQTGP